jgi:hypothetical protein
MGEGWDRLESMVRGVDLDEGLAARIADPLWMLARQRQVGEFTGDDAAQPAGVRVRGRWSAVATYRAGDTDPVPFPRDLPLEAVVEAIAEPDLGSAGLHAAARTGRRLVRMLRDAGLAAAVPKLRSAFPLPAGPGRDLGEAARAAAELLAYWAVDGRGAAAATDAEFRNALGGVLDDAGMATFGTVLAAWRRWYGPPVSAPAWRAERLEYDFSLGVATGDGEVVLAAPEHTGTDLDWYSFDLGTGDKLEHGLTPTPPATFTVTRLPSPIRYVGMPASRWWEFEDGAVNFGDVEAGPADVARLLVAEFATVYGDDWYVVPLRLPVGALAELVEVEVIDTFGGRTRVPSTAAADAKRLGTARSWRMFELAGDEPGPGHPAPWLFVAPCVAGSVDGPVLERIAFTRDEAANLAWGVEQLIEGPLGRGVARAEAWQAYRARDESTVDDPELWRYRLGGEAPPWWIPFVAERLDATRSAEVRLRRARLQAWDLLHPTAMVGPRSGLLDHRRPQWLYEEEVPRGGVRVERAWQLARWHDGSLRVWLRQRKLPGRGDRGSGLRWDVLRRTHPGAAGMAG